jgi:NAD(P)H-flavin reductase
MHKYWSKKPSEVIAEYIKSYTDRGDIVLDPFSGYGVTAIEALRLGRRAIAIDLNPMATFITKVILEPVNLPHLQWAFQDIQEACQNEIYELFVTKCSRCGDRGVIDFTIRENDKPIQVAYRCKCCHERLFKEPDEYDQKADNRSADMEIPFWYPSDVLLPPIQKERFKYLHELFTKRNLIALSMILYAIGNLTDERVRDVMKLTFTSSLDKCSRLKPLSKKVNGGHFNLSESWVAVRFYAPRLWQEVNPWKVFENTFGRIYGGKKESNSVLQNATVGYSYKDLESGEANVVVINGSAEKILAEELPQDTIDYVLTDPPFGSAIQYLPLSAFWGAWLGFNFDYENEIVVASRRGKTFAEYTERMRSAFEALTRVTKDGSYVHVFYNDIKGPYLHKILNLLEESKIIPEHILHQPPPKSFSYSARERKGHYGSYVIRGLVSKREPIHVARIPEEKLCQRLAQAAQVNLSIRGNETTPGAILHSFYQQLNRDEISAFAKYSAQNFLLQSVGSFAEYHQGKLRPLEKENIRPLQQKILRELRHAVLDAESVLAHEEDITNRVHQLAMGRIGSDGLTPDDVWRVRKDISDNERSEHWRKRRIELLCDFGELLGFQSNSVHNGWTGVTWTKPGVLQCNFELQKKGIRVFAGSHLNSVSEWGTISYFDLECKMVEWCKNNPIQGQRLLGKLNRFEGPSYTISATHRNGPHTSQSQSLRLKVVQNRLVCPQHFLMQLEIPRGTKLNFAPGQFFHMVCDPTGGDGQGYPLTLRRPFSVHGAQYLGFSRSILAKAGDMPREIRDVLIRWPSKIDFLYKLVGKGTESLSQVSKGTSIDAIGPCGNGFTIGSERAAVIVAGGIGIAPLVALVERLRYLDKEVYIYLGALRQEFLALAITRPDSAVDFSYANGTQEFYEMIGQDFQEIGANEIRVCTDDGSVGEKGLVTHILEKDMRKERVPRSDVCFYACGPQGMLRSVSEIARQNSVECQVLLEERMGCGIGACLSCSCEVVGPDGTVQKKRVCRDGPVFRATEVKWKG